MEQKPYFSKEITNVIKGVALIMMFIHHDFAFPDRWGGVICYPFFVRVADYIRAPFRICVPVFCFLTGYTYFFQKRKTFGYSLKKILTC